jgi:putative spermidine/putrescine transport system substrate-binding protein
MNGKKGKRGKAGGGDGISRRDFLKKSSIVAAGAIAGTGIFGNGPYVFTPAYAAVEIRTVGLAVSIIPDIQKKATEDLKMKVIGQALGSEAMVQKQRNQPEQYEISEGYFYDLDITWPGYQPIDTKRIKDWDKLNPLVTEGYLDTKSNKIRADGIMGDGEAPRKLFYVDNNGQITRKKSRWVTMVPAFHNADSLGYNADEIPYPVTSWGELFNPKWKGKTAIIDVANIGTQDTALAMQAIGAAKFKDMGNMTRKEIDTLIDFLIQKKKEGHFRAFWGTFPQSVQLMVSGEVVIESMWSPAVTVARTKGTNCVYADMAKEGYRGWHGGFAISKDVKGKTLDACYNYINWWCSGWAGAFVGRQGYYMHWQEKVKKFLTSAEWDYWYEGTPAKTKIVAPDGTQIAKVGEVRDGGSYYKRMGNIYSWNSFPKEIDYMVKRWNELKAA